MADGTAPKCGRVGSCHILYKRPNPNKVGAFYFMEKSISYRLYCINNHYLMNRYIAFLRAVNVGGRVVKMEEIRRILSTNEFQNVTTYIQSGNVIFDSAEKKVANITEKIETTLSESLGYKVSVVIRTIPEIANIIKDNPFGEPSATEQLYVSFLSDVPDGKNVTILSASLATQGEKIEVINKEAYILCEKGTYGNSIFSNNFLEKKLKVIATTRNWATVNKMMTYDK